MIKAEWTNKDSLDLQQTCIKLASDCISRRTAIKAVEDLQDCYNGFSDTYDKACIIGAIEEVPPAQLEQKNGKWIKGIGENGVTTSLFCSNCNYENRHWYEWNYCPNCGTRMESESEYWAEAGKAFAEGLYKGLTERD